MKTGTKSIIDEGEGAPNLDGQSADDLREFAEDIRDDCQTIADAIFPAKPTGYLDATLRLGVYAALKMKAVQCRGAGSIKAALKIEAACDRQYQTLPDFARW